MLYGNNVFPETNKFRIFDSVAAYRRHLAANLAEERCHDAVDVVGMRTPQPEPAIDSRGGRDF